ncbi:MAG: hypothetical protein R8P61_02950 [Bacteroidia bacterium]|nr:hypothetical protein [Bacteroidia bacterium]
MSASKTILTTIAVLCLFFLLGVGQDSKAAKDSRSSKSPNVILVLTDDQGIGDLSAHGNPWLKNWEITNLGTFTWRKI